MIEIKRSKNCVKIVNKTVSVSLKIPASEKNLKVLHKESGVFSPIGVELKEQNDVFSFTSPCILGISFHIILNRKKCEEVIELMQDILVQISPIKVNFVDGIVWHAILPHTFVHFNRENIIRVQDNVATIRVDYNTFHVPIWLLTRAGML